jgi:Family of unknown function (DUF5689)/Domain of unknown function (DUF5017)
MPRMFHSKLPHALLALSVIALFGGCKKEFDSPPKQVLATGDVLTIAELKALWTGASVHFEQPTSVYAVVTADENNGNLYKTVFVQDQTGGLQLRLLTSGGLYQGDSVRIALQGTALGQYQGQWQLDSVNADVNVVKQATLVNVQPRVTTVAEILANPQWQCTLLRVTDVEFSCADLGQTWADPIAQSSANRTLTSCAGDQIILRSSGYSNFAGQAVPLGHGAITCVLGVFGATPQLTVRSMSEVNMTDDRCTCPPPVLCDPVTTVNQDFSTSTSNVDIALPCWINVFTGGSRVWRGKTLNGQLCAQATSYTSTDPVNVTWLISPLTTYNAGMTLSFSTSKAFWTHDPFGVFVSTDFNATNTSTATWVPIACTRASQADADDVFIPSGAVDLSTYLSPGQNFVIGFKYTGSGPNSQTTSYRVDDVVIQ